MKKRKGKERRKGTGEEGERKKERGAVSNTPKPSTTSN
jgi:hypothetical protein